MGEAKLTLVFPCWHAAKHMPHVLEDLQAQTFPDFEAILVNDGDDSQVEAMEQIAAQDSRIRLVHRKENGGVAAARNAGTDAATTPWITYPDPDDRIGPNYAKSLYEAVDGTDVEMACGGYTWVEMLTGEITSRYINMGVETEVIAIAKAYEKMLPPDCEFTNWNILYSTELIRRNRLRQNVSFTTGQDYLFNMEYFPFVRKVGLVRDCGYFYYNRLGTNGKRYDPQFMLNRLQIIHKRESFHQQLGWPEERIAAFKNTELAYRALRFCSYYLFSFQSPLTIKTATQKVREELFGQKELVSAILERDCGNDRLMCLFQKLVRKGNARLLVITFYVLSMCKRRFGSLYAKTKTFFRGN